VRTTRLQIKPNLARPQSDGIDVLYMIHLYNIIMVYIHDHFDLIQHFMCKGKSRYTIFIDNVLIDNNINFLTNQNLFNTLN
jgi:hypothetical protein